MSETKTELNYELHYVSYIESGNLDVSKFPKSIDKKIRIIKMLIGKFNAEPTNARKEHIIREDIATANLIADWVEKDYPDEFIDPTPSSEEFEDEKQPVVTSVTPSTTPVTPPTPVVEVIPNNTEDVPPTPVKSVEEQNTSDLVAAQEKRVMESKYGNRIKAQVLRDIIGKSPEYPIQKVGKITLKKVWMGDAYEIVM